MLCIWKFFSNLRWDCLNIRPAPILHRHTVISFVVSGYCLFCQKYPHFYKNTAQLKCPSRHGVFTHHCGHRAQVLWPFFRTTQAALIKCIVTWVNFFLNYFSDKTFC